MNKSCILLIFLLLSFSGFAQTKKFTEKDYAQKPIWIQLMDIEGVNFNETLKAYDIYWQHHALPEEEGDRYVSKGEQQKQKLSKKELREIREGAEMRFQVKKFLHWKIKNEPFVKENGNIMTAAERIEFHNKNQ
ncbi:MAG: hypothetical protein ABI685_04750 [Ferruginibacter sp.]